MRWSSAVFLVSDQCWQDILSLVPIAIRPVGKPRLPVLIYHQEGNTIDVDAIVHFLRSYLASKGEGRSDMAIVHVGATSPGVLPTLVMVLEDYCGIARGQMLQKNPIWELQRLYKSMCAGVIVARDDYETGLIAAPFAALKGAHLCFLDTETLEAYKPLMHELETIYLVGQLDEQVSDFFNSLSETQIHRMTAEDIQKEYVKEVQTDKIILVNPRDLDLHYEEPTNTLLETTPGGEIRCLYGKCSLVAPFLAAAKQEVIIPVSDRYPKRIDDILKQAIADLELKPSYLTIVASPEAIPMSAFDEKRRYMVELDGRVYGRAQNLEDVDLAVGRIFGITVSDCSAYVARVLFFKALAPSQEPRALLILVKHLEPGHDENGAPRFDNLLSKEELQKYLDHCWTEEAKKAFDDKQIIGDGGRLDDEQKVLAGSLYPKANLIVYMGHASYDGFEGVMSTAKLVENNTRLDGFPVILGIGCLTGAYELTKHERMKMANLLSERGPKLARLFVAQNIRRGAMAQQCAVSLAYWHDELDELLKALYVNGDSLGKAICLAKNSERHLFDPEDKDKLGNFSSRFDGDPHYLLVGDPTFVPKDYIS